jgi:hypothetical protein
LVVIQGVRWVEHQKVDDNNLSQIKELASSSCDRQDKNPKKAHSRNQYVRDPCGLIWQYEVLKTVIILGQSAWSINDLETKGPERQLHRCKEVPRRLPNALE